VSSFANSTVFQAAHNDIILHSFQTHIQHLRHQHPNDTEVAKTRPLQYTIYKQDALNNLT